MPIDARSPPITRSISSLVRFDDDGRHTPRAYIDSAISPPTRAACANIGCVCIGRQTGRASMSAADFTQATEIADAYRRRHEWPAERIDFASGFFNGYDDSTHCEKHVAPRK